MGNVSRENATAQSWPQLRITSRKTCGRPHKNMNFFQNRFHRSESTWSEADRLMNWTRWQIHISIERSTAINTQSWQQYRLDSYVCKKPLSKHVWVNREVLPNWIAPVCMLLLVRPMLLAGCQGCLPDLKRQGQAFQTLNDKVKPTPDFNR